VDAQNFNGKGLLIGGSLSRTTSNWGNINVKSFVQGTRTGNWNWNTNTVGPFSALVDFEHFRYLSRNAVSSTASDGSKVVVINSGGTFSSPSALGSGFDQNTQNVLIIFNTDADVILNFGMNNLNFSILAPRSKLTVTVDQRDIRGFLIGRELVVTGGNISQQVYTGTPSCLSGPAITPAPITTSAPLPTPAPITGGSGTCACKLPDYLKQKKFTLITKGDATHSAHSVYTALAIGGKLTAYEPTTSKTVAQKSYMQAIVPATNYGINFNGGVQISATPLTDAGIDFSVLECVAKNAKSSEVPIPGSSKTYKVVVFTKGGSYSMDDVRDTSGQYVDEDNGITLVIFNTSDDVRLVFNNNRKFGPSVLAPFSLVTVDDNNDFVDGYIVARQFMSTKTAQQLHGDAFQGDVSCGP
jgi:hypothetical protein